MPSDFTQRRKGPQRREDDRFQILDFEGETAIASAQGPDFGGTLLCVSATLCVSA